MKRGIVSKIIQISLCISIVAAMIIAMIFLIRATKQSASEDPQTMSLSYNGQEIPPSAEMYFEAGKPQRFEIKAQDYTVKIIPNPDENFQFSAGEKPYMWSAMGDLSRFFGLQTAAGSFTLTYPEGLNVPKILQSLFPDEPAMPFALIVSDGKAVFEIRFAVWIPAEDFNVNHDHFAF